jgi:VIT1/CCC1 family predicted Fe2+/Mn2+ transporter
MPEQPGFHQHRDIRGGGARAAVFGLSDGLVTNVSLVLGIAGASPGGQIVRLVGVAGLVAGAFSMGAGEYLSMAAQRELMERELDVERQALRQSPEGEAMELRGMYEQRGIAPAVARDMVDEVMQDPELALETHAREELGISPRIWAPRCKRLCRRSCRSRWARSSRSCPGSSPGATGRSWRRSSSPWWRP